MPVRRETARAIERARARWLIWRGREVQRKALPARMIFALSNGRTGSGMLAKL